MPRPPQNLPSPSPTNLALQLLPALLEKHCFLSRYSAMPVAPALARSLMQNASFTERPKLKGKQRKVYLSNSGVELLETITVRLPCFSPRAKRLLLAAQVFSAG